MEYSVSKLAALSGVSPRTLRYYHEIGLLMPLRIEPSGYRVYGPAEVDALQQILLFRAQGFSLDSIAALLYAPDFDRAQTYERHLDALYKQRAQLDRLIGTVRRSAAAMKGEMTMSDHEKFEAFKQGMLEENERLYGSEVRERYGDEAADASNAHWMGIPQETYEEGERLRLAFEEALEAAVREGDPSGKTAQRACDLHRQWLCIFYPRYSKDYHRGLGEMYAADDRFRMNYDKLAPGCTEFLRDAINIYCGEPNAPA